MNRSQHPDALLQQARAYVEKPLGLFQAIRKYVTPYDAKYDDYKKAIELYKQAAIILIKQRQQIEAAQAYEQAAELELRVKRDDYANESFTKAASNYGDADAVGRARCLERMISYWVDTRGNFPAASPYAKTLAGVYEKQLKDETKALETYQNAADWVSDKPFTRRGLLPNVAELASKRGDYARGAENWEETARLHCDSGSITVPSAYPCLFKAGLCRLVNNDMVAISRAFSSYCQMAPGFQRTPEYQTLSEIVDIIERGEPPKVFDAITDKYWERIYRRPHDPKDPYLVMMFDRNKAEIKETPDDFS